MLGGTPAGARTRPNGNGEDLATACSVGARLLLVLAPNRLAVTDVASGKVVRAVEDGSYLGTEMA